MVVVLLTALGLSRLVDFETGGPRLLLDPSANSMLPADSEESRYYERIRELFGNDEQVVVALHAPEIFTTENLRAVVRSAERIAELDGLRRVESLAALLRNGEPDPVSGEPSVVVPEDLEVLEQLRTATLENPVLGGNLVSLDSRTTALVVMALSAIGMVEYRFQVPVPCGPAT